MYCACKGGWNFRAKNSLSSIAILKENMYGPHLLPSLVRYQGDMRGTASGQPQPAFAMLSEHWPPHKWPRLQIQAEEQTLPASVLSASAQGLSNWHCLLLELLFSRRNAFCIRLLPEIKIRCCVKRKFPHSRLYSHSQIGIYISHRLLEKSLFLTFLHAFYFWQSLTR